MTPYQKSAAAVLEHGKVFPNRLEAERFVETATLDTIEAHVKVLPLLQVAIETLPELLGELCNDKKLAQRLYDHLPALRESLLGVAQNGNPLEYSELLKSALANLESPDFGQPMVNFSMFDYREEQLVMYILENLHDAWREQNVARFFADGGEQYRFLPFELIGWEAVSRLLLYVDAFFRAVGIFVNQERLKHFYETRRATETLCYASFACYVIRSATDLLVAWITDVSEIERTVAETEAEKSVYRKLSDRYYVEAVILPQLSRLSLGPELYNDIISR